MKTIPYGKQSIDKSDIDAVVAVLKSSHLTQGPAIKKFEYELASYTGARYTIALNSGTAALHAAYFALGLDKNDEFITSPMTFAATSNAGLYLRAKPIFVDIEPDTGNIDVSKIEKLITKKTKLIVPIHYSGYPADLESIDWLAKKFKLHVVEDGCHALGAKFQKEKIGNCKYSDMTIFSFHPVKHITTGEGGAITTNNKKFYEKLTMFRTHGIIKDRNNLINKNEANWYYEMQSLGYNYRLTDIQAALGMSQLKKIDQFITKRRIIAGLYDNAFKKNAYFNVIKESKDTQAAYHLYPILLKDTYKNKKKKIFDTFRKRGIGVQVHYIPVYLHPYYHQIGFKKGLCPIAEDFYEREISIPMYYSLKRNEINFIIKTVMDVFENI
jgi:UDP-4-amino-4,6-dideoxy-N-acetyl-beta-L-altrosamine transaminase